MPTPASPVPITEHKRRNRRRRWHGKSAPNARAQRSVGLLVTKELEVATAKCKDRVSAIAKECRAKNHKFRDYDWDISIDKVLCLKGCQGIDVEDSDSDSGDDESSDDSSDEPVDLPPDVLRVSDIFDDPEFFKDGASSSDIEQGRLGDCWFLSALSTLATVPGLLDRICVARDEAVGVYGFIFFRDGKWVDIVIDDLLFVSNPKFGELKYEEQRLYHFNHDLYDSTARKGSKSIHFAKSRTEGETWVPLIEKAYAKLHGDYAALEGGYPNEAIEDLTGGVCNTIRTMDILDRNQFWQDLLVQIRDSHLFGCYMPQLSNERNGQRISEVHGLIPLHAYSVLKAVNYRGKRFVLLRNPWGEGEWNGKWSDGSAEWTGEWLGLLEVLQHKPGNDGVFVMEYNDFLKQFGTIESTRLFDENWVTSSYWLQLRGLSVDRAWSYGDVSWTFAIPETTPTIIVLQQIDDRYFRDHIGWLTFHFDFVLFKKGSKEPLARPVRNAPYSRSVGLELELEPGDYVVQVRIDISERQEKNWYADNVSKWDRRKVARQKAERAIAYSIAANFQAQDYADELPVPLEVFADRDVVDVGVEFVEAKRQEYLARKAVIDAVKEVRAKKGKEEQEKANKEGDDQKGNDQKGGKEKEKEKEKEKAAKPTKDAVRKISKKGGERNKSQVIDAVHVSEDDDSSLWEDEDDDDEGDDDEDEDDEDENYEDESDEDEDDEDEDDEDEDDGTPAHGPVYCDGCGMSPIKGPRFKCVDSRCPNYDLCESCAEAGIHPAEHRLLRFETPEEVEKYLRDDGIPDDDSYPSLVLGLRVYTREGAPASVEGFISRVKNIKQT